MPYFEPNQWKTGAGGIFYNSKAVLGSGASAPTSVLTLNQANSGVTGTVSGLSISSSITGTGATAATAMNISSTVTGVGNVAYGLSLSPTVSSDTNNSMGIRMVPTVDPTAPVSQLLGLNNNWNIGKSTGSNTNSISTAVGNYVRNSVGAGYSGTITNLYAIQIPNTVNSTATITKLVGVAVGEQSGGTNNTNLLVGTSTIPTGDFSIYNPSTRANHFSGSLGIGTTVADKKLEINSATGNNLRLTYNDSNGSAANYVDLLVSSSGDLTVTPSGGDMTLAGTLDVTAYKVGAVAGASGTFTTADAKTVTVTNGLITSIV